MIFLDDLEIKRELTSKNFPQKMSNQESAPVKSEDSIDEVKETKSPKSNEQEPISNEIFASSSEIRREKSNQQIFADLIRNFLVTNQKQPESVLKSLNIFQKILANIVESPLNPKFRLLKRGKRALELKIFCFPELTRLLEIVGFEEISGEQFSAKHAKLDLAAAERNYYLNDSLVNVDVIENVLEIVREAKLEVCDYLETRGPAKMPAQMEIRENESK